VDGVRVVGEAADGDEAIERVRELTPDVIVMDMRMPRMSGIDSTREITRNGPPPRVLMLSAYGDESLVRQALQAGAWSFLLKDAPPQEIAEAVIATASGKCCFSQEVRALSLDRSTLCKETEEGKF
jgi:DNA-binding NarL/FixJ family response regulator